jgi:hypothetical protein
MNWFTTLLRESLWRISAWTAVAANGLEPCPMYRIIDHRSGQRWFSDEADGYEPVEAFAKSLNSACNVDVIEVPYYRARRIPPHQMLTRV